MSEPWSAFGDYGNTKPLRKWARVLSGMEVSKDNEIMGPTCGESGLAIAKEIDLSRPHRAETRSE